MINEVKKILEKVQKNEMNIDDALVELRFLPYYEDLGFAKVDHHRAFRLDFPEVIYGRGKTKDEVVAIALSLYRKNEPFLVTRTGKKTYEALKNAISEVEFNPKAGLISFKGNIEPKEGKILIVTAGTSDEKVAEEALETLNTMGYGPKLLTDVGIAGLHRLLAYRKELSRAEAIIVCAGMEGALAGVIAAMVMAPVIAVPTSIGYGASKGGYAALLSMLSSCAPGIAVVNIDNGFGAAFLAHRILSIKSQNNFS